MAAISTKSASPFFTLPFLLFLSLALLSATAQRCPSFSCGQLQDVSYPFRRRDDPPKCGEALYQLNCHGNKSTFFIGSVEYLVTEFQYKKSDSMFKDTKYEMKLRLVDQKFVSVGSCGLPSQPLSPSTLPKLGYDQFSSAWASFMNCSKSIQNDSRYWPISCLSNSHNSTFVYVFIAEDGYKLQYLHPSCEFMSMIPVDRMIMNSTVDAFSILQHGFEFLFHESSMEIIGPWVRMFLQLYLAPIRLLGPIFVLFFFLYKYWSIRRQNAMDTVEKFLRRQQMFMPTRYAYTSIIAITRHFKEKLGQGGFGSVFKGEFVGGVLVAVKIMESSKCNGDDFISEVSTIGRIHHINVVRLVGYCSEGSKRALVYEYMPNGSLDKYIFSNKNGANLHTFTSEKLFDIAMGIARGIDYLHRGCDMQILHFDIKPHNILLDHNFTPKISDFGLAKLYPKDNSLVSISAARGTIGYIAPELISRSFGVISQKSDVYSYGMLLLEMAGRRRNVDPLAGDSSQVYYPSWIYDKLNQQQDIKLDNNFEINESEKKLAVVGLWCIQMKSFNRPTMTKVIEMLESDVETIPVPPKPFFSSMDSILENKTCLVSSSTELSVVVD